MSFYHLCRCFYDIMHYTLREVLSHKLIAPPPPARLIKVPVSSHGSERSCACVLDVSIMPFILFYNRIFGTLSRACIFLGFITILIEHIHHRFVSQKIVISIYLEIFWSEEGNGNCSAN